jgi:hypothetical protein
MNSLKCLLLYRGKHCVLHTITLPPLFMLVRSTCLLLATTLSSFAQIPADGDVFADTWVATDGIGRKLPTYAEVGPPRADRQVGLFYFLWVSRDAHNKQDIPVQDITQILAKDPLAPKWGNPGSFHFWGEPELGYYDIKDPFVLTRHRSMLTAAGIDTLFFDQTNSLVYPDEMLAVCENLDQGRRQGLPVPKVAAMHNSRPERSVPQLHSALYAANKYPELWFKWLGKPLLLSNPATLSPAMKDFFTIRHTWAWSSAKWFGDGRDKWTWVDWSPQGFGWHESPSKPEQTSVCVAPHPLDGRGRSSTGGKSAPSVPVEKLRTADGIYAADQWRHALKLDPPFIFVTGWNEWVAQRQVWGKPHKPKQMAYTKLGEGDTYFVDQYNQEFSRDMEPMKNGHSDNYYYQLVANIRRYKGVRPPTVPVTKPITIDGAFSDWKGVLPEFRDFQGDTLHRNFYGWTKLLQYTDTTGRNDIVRAHVSPSKESVAFHVTCAAPISAAMDPCWMRLYIDADLNSKTGWNGYDFIVNRNAPTAAGLSLHLIKDGKSTELPRIPYSVKGTDLELSLPRALFGSAPLLSFDFKWADNQQKDGDVTEFALHGDSAPDRRFNYRYDQSVTEALIKTWTAAAAQARLSSAK